MKNRIQVRAVALMAAASLTLAACGGRDKSASNGDVATPAANSGYSTPTTVRVDTVQKHHSKLGGAVAGAAAGHMLGGHAVLGAAAGALIQHHRNKQQ